MAMLQHSATAPMWPPQGGYHPQAIRGFFSPAEQHAMLDEDVSTARHVAALLVSIVTMGLVGMIVTVLWIVG